MIQRTTLTADASDLAVLKAEAHRRRVPLARVLMEVIADAAAVRRTQRPRPAWGIFDGGPDLARDCANDEDSPAGDLRRS